MRFRHLTNSQLAQSQALEGREPATGDISGTPTEIWQHVQHGAFDRAKPGLKAYLMTTSVKGGRLDDFYKTVETIRSSPSGQFDKG